VPTGFVRQVIANLPLERPHVDELRTRIDDLANLMWPSLRAAIGAIVDYIKARAQGMDTSKAWYRALQTVAASHEDIVKDATRGWCENPRRMIGDWQTLSLNSRGKGSPPLGRTQFLLQESLVHAIEQPGSNERLLRILLKAGVLLVGPDQRYQLGPLPAVLEVPPLLLVKGPFDFEHYDPSPVRMDLTTKMLGGWSRGRRRQPRSTKIVFVSYWMSDPSRSGTSELEAAVRKRFGVNIDIRTGEIASGSPQWSPEILSKIGQADLLLCDLTVPRRDVFVEYGVAVGSYKPVMQCRANKVRPRWPAWLEARQFQYYAGNSKERGNFDASVASLLDNEGDLVAQWKRDADGKSLVVAPQLKRVLCVGSALPPWFVDQLEARCSEIDFDFRLFTVARHSDDLGLAVKLARGAGTVILCFDGTDNDYFTAVLGGGFACRTHGSWEFGGSDPGKKRFTRKLYVLDVSSRDGGQATDEPTDVIPGLLRTHPRARVCTYQQCLDAVKGNIKSLAAITRRS